jgi:hypothetical protein
LFFSRETSACLQVPQVLPSFRSFARLTDKLVKNAKSSVADDFARPAIWKYHKRIPKTVFKKQISGPKLRSSPEQKMLKTVIQQKHELAIEVKEWENRQKEIIREGFEFSAFLVDLSEPEQTVINSENLVISEPNSVKEFESLNAEFLSFQKGLEGLVSQPFISVSSKSQSNFEITSLDSIESADYLLDLVWPVVDRVKPIPTINVESIPSSIQVTSAASIKSPLMQATTHLALTKIKRSIDPELENEKAGQLIASDPTQTSSQLPGDPSQSKSRDLSEIQETNTGEKLYSKDLDSKSIYLEEMAPVSHDASKISVNAASRNSTFSRYNIFREWNSGTSPMTLASPIKIKQKMHRGYNAFFDSSPVQPGSKLKLVIGSRLTKEISAGRSELTVRNLPYGREKC